MKRRLIVMLVLAGAMLPAGTLYGAFCDGSIIDESFDGIAANTGLVPTDWFASKNGGYVGVYKHSDLGVDNVMRVQDYSSANASLYVAAKDGSGNYIDFGNTYAVEFDFKVFLNRSQKTMLLSANSANGWGTFNKFFLTGSGGSYAISNPAGTVVATVDGTEHHLLYATDNGQYTLYIDGSIVDSGVATVRPAGNAQRLILGQSTTSDYADLAWDNIKVGNLIVPEPATMSLCLVGLAGVLMKRK